MNADLEKAMNRAMKRLAATPKPQAVRSFIPAGRASFTIYAVSLTQHPGVTKVGRTSKWEGRLKSYQSWNLSPGNAVQSVARFIITEEFVDLPALEKHVLAVVGTEFPIHFGAEWFKGEHEDVARAVDKAITLTGLEYDVAFST